MKVKYKFNNIYSEADNLILKAYGVEIAKFAKSDFGENWEGLKEKTFELNPYLVGDIDKLTITGNEENVLPCNKEKEKKLWKDYAADKIDFSMLNTSRFNEILSNDKIETIIFSNTKENNYYNLPSTLSNKLSNCNKLLDFSNLQMKSYIEYGNLNFFTNNNKIIKKLPKINGFVKPNYNESSEKKLRIINFENLEDISDFFNKEYTVFDFENNNKIEDLSQSQITFNDYKPSEPKYKFKNCKKLKLLPKLPYSASIIESFLGCESLQEIEEIGTCIAPNRFENALSTNSDLHVKKILFYIEHYSRTVDGHETSNVEGEAYFKDIKKDDKKLSIDYLAIPFANNFIFGENLPNSINIGVVNFGDSSLDKCTVSNWAPRFDSSIKLFETPLNIKAFPFSYNSRINKELPETTSIDDNRIVWCDYIETPTKNFKSITNSATANKTVTVNTLKKQLKANSIEISVPLSFELNPEYPYAFKLLKETFYIEGGNSKTSTDKKYSLYFREYKDSNAIFTISSTIDNISDNLTIKFENILFNDYYTAEIEGYEFHGLIKMKINVNVVFNLDEQVTPSFTFEDDEGNELNLPLNNPAE